MTIVCGAKNALITHMHLFPDLQYGNIFVKKTFSFGKKNTSESVVPAVKNNPIKMLSNTALHGAIWRQTQGEITSRLHLNPKSNLGFQATDNMRFPCMKMKKIIFHGKLGCILLHAWFPHP